MPTKENGRLLTASLAVGRLAISAVSLVHFCSCSIGRILSMILLELLISELEIFVSFRWQLFHSFDAYICSDSSLLRALICDGGLIRFRWTGWNLSAVLVLSWFTTIEIVSMLTRFEVMSAVQIYWSGHLPQWCLSWSLDVFSTLYGSLNNTQIRILFSAGEDGNWKFSPRCFNVSDFFGFCCWFFQKMCFSFVQIKEKKKWRFFRFGLSL